MSQKLGATLIELITHNAASTKELQTCLERHYPDSEIYIREDAKLQLEVTSVNAALDLRQFAFDTKQLEQLLPLREFLEKAGVTPPQLAIRTSSSVVCLELPGDITRKLLRGDIETLSQLLFLSEVDLKDIRGIGSKRCELIKARLAEYELELKKYQY